MPDRNRKPNGGRPEFEVAYYTKELGKDLQREMLRKQLARLSESTKITSSHGEDTPPQLDTAPPQEDRAG
jgi:hypothetical protein